MAGSQRDGAAIHQNRQQHRDIQHFAIVDEVLLVRAEKMQV